MTFSTKFHWEVLVMISTIIIDDNKIIREHFQKLIDWESNGFDVVSITSNGILGWKAFNEYKPQLVITDVRMPGMTGVELAKKIKEVSSATMVVFISNYEDFNYVKAALDIGVYDYILKHETRGKKFYEKLYKIKKAIEKNFTDKKCYYESKLQSAFSSHDIKSLKEVFDEKYSLLLFEQISFLPTFLELTNVQCDEISESDIKSLCYSFSEKIISAVRVEKYRYAVLFEGENPENLSSKLCDYLRDKTKTNFYVLPVCEEASVTECFDAYEAAKSYMTFKFFNKYSCVIIPSKYASYVNQPDHLDASKIMDAARDTDVDEACKIFDAISQSIIEKRNYNSLCDLTSKLLNFFITQNQLLVKEKLIIYNEDDNKFWTYADEILFWLKNKLIQIIGLLKNSPDSGYSDTVKKAIEYINCNYMKSDLTAGDIADQVGMDANHLNKLIKKESGSTLIKWLTNTRLEKAKQMLDEHQKISYVCQAVGYVNISYFSNVFKKNCGETPLEYRRRSNEKNS